MALVCILYIDEDGAFYGNYHDSDMGVSGDDYPYGTCYISKFKGQFGQPKKVNDYTYKIAIENMELEKEKDTEIIEDGIKYIYTEPFGLEGTKELLIYLPDAPVKELPETFTDWIQTYMIEDSNEKLSFYGIYNEEAGPAFYSYKDESMALVDEELKSLEKRDAEIEEQYLESTLSQVELNQLASEHYELWDGELNRIWSFLEDVLDKDEMEKLRKEEREWIAYKEEEVKKAGKEKEGGTLQPFVENEKAAELTKERVYELVKLYRGAR